MPSRSEADVARAIRLSQGIPARYARWTLSDFAPAAVERVATWAASSKWCLYMAGGVGTRKSSLAAAIVMAARLGGHRSMFAPMDVAIKQIRSFHDWWIEQAGECELLVLDDLGAARDTPHVHETLNRILLGRYDRELATVLTSNLPLATLRTEYDERLADRIREGYHLCPGQASRRVAGEEKPQIDPNGS